MMHRMPPMAVAYILPVIAMLTLQTMAGPPGGLQEQFRTVDRQLRDAERAAGSTPEATPYLRQARQLFNKAWADYSSYRSPSTTLWNPAQFRPYDTFGYKLKRDANGRLVPLDSNPADLETRAEAWSKQMSDMLSKIEAMRKGDQADLTKEVNSMLKGLGLTPPASPPAVPATLGGEAEAEINTLGHATPPASVNPYAGDPDVVDLRDSKTLTPQWLRPPEVPPPTPVVEKTDDIPDWIRNTNWPKEPDQAKAPRDLTVGYLASEVLGGDEQEKAGTQLFVDIIVDETTPIGTVSTTRDSLKLTGQVFDLGGRISDAMTSGDINDWKKAGSGALEAGDTAIGLIPVVGSMWNISKWMVEPPPPVIGR